MCGCDHDAPSRRRGGALAALTPPRPASPPSSPSSSCPAASVRADLAFHTPGLPRSQTATHARLTPDCLSALKQAELSIVIHTLGDMTADIGECGTFRRFIIPEDTSIGDDHSFVEVALPDPISIAVGGPGIIGRRVSLFSRRADDHEMLIAEGIVGFNI